MCRFTLVPPSSSIKNDTIPNRARLQSNLCSVLPGADPLSEAIGAE